MFKCRTARSNFWKLSLPIGGFNSHVHLVYRLEIASRAVD
jgi:hypothetical protein